METKKQISPERIRKSVKDQIAKTGKTPGQFYREFASTLGITVKQRTFEMFVTSSKMRGVACLIPVYEYFHPGTKIVKEGVHTHFNKWFVVTKQLAVAGTVDNPLNLGGFGIAP